MVQVVEMKWMKNCKNTIFYTISDELHWFCIASKKSTPSGLTL